jgi:hypothetical protein
MLIDDPRRAMLRHCVATLAYRGGKAIRGVDDTFSAFRASPTSRTPGEILAHLGDLLDWGLSIAQGKQAWKDAPVRTWAEDSARFHAGLAALDAQIAGCGALGCEPERLFQGAIADALTHVGQLNFLRGMAGVPVRGENYYVADIVAGRVGAEQPAPRREFD